MSFRLRTCLLGILALFAAVSISGAGPLIRLQAGVFDPVKPTGSTPKIATAGSTTASPYKIVQFSGPLKTAVRRSLESTGATVIGYVPDYAYVVRMNGNSESKVRSMKGINWVGTYMPSYKYSPSLAAVPSTYPMELNVILFPGENANSVAETIKGLGLNVLSVLDKSARPRIRIEGSTAALSVISQMDAVQWVEEFIAPVFHNDVARSISTVDTTWSKLGLYGQGQIVAVCDTGLDTGNTSTMTRDLRGRVIKGYGLGTDRAGDWSDLNAHGTHTTGTIAGNGTLSNGASNLNNSFAGVAPQAQIVMQSVEDKDADENGNKMRVFNKFDLQNLFEPVYTDDNARVHSDSWGLANYGEYDQFCQDLDRFAWNHKDMVIVFSAGNEGIDISSAVGMNSDGIVDRGSVGSPGSSKNCICVGATESLRLSGGEQTPWGQWTYINASGERLPKFPVPPISTDLPSDNPEGIAPFSSRGPAAGGRIKPDICAPGTNIISCASHAPGAGDGWGAYNSDYNYMGGTSMSCPHVSGAAALIREYFLKNQNWTYISAAMVKAVMINGAKDLTPGAYGYGSTQQVVASPDDSQGWGRLDLYRSLTSKTGSGIIDFIDETQGLDTGMSKSKDYTVNEGDEIRATMVYTDYPAELGAGNMLVNDLDLVVKNPKAKTFYPNGLKYWSDWTNPTEDVVLTSRDTIKGTYKVTVAATSVATTEPQPYALVVRIDKGPAYLDDSTMVSSPTETCAPGGEITYTINVVSGGSPTVNGKVTDVIPANTTYVAGSTTLNSAAVADTGGHSPLESGMLVNTPGCAAGVVNRSAPAIVTFKVRVNDGLAEATPLVNNATVTSDPVIPTESMFSFNMQVNMRTPITRRVALGGQGNGTSWANAAPSITVAAKTMLSGDRVWVKAGTYLGSSTLHNGILLYGGFTGNETLVTQRDPVANVTILDGGYVKDHSVIVSLPGVECAVVDGFTIKNGKGNPIRSGGSTPWRCGGAICADKAPIAINNCIIKDNKRSTDNPPLGPHRGGGVYCTGTVATITNCVFTSNTVGANGFSGSGGAIYCASTAGVITGNTFSGNQSTPNGGAIYCAPGSHVTISNNKITSSGATNGAAIYCDNNSVPVITNNWIGTGVAELGGGIFCGLNVNATITNNTIVKNTATRGYGAGIALYSANATVVNNILSFSTAGIGISKIGSGNVTLRNNCLYKNVSGDYYGLVAGTGDISKDPLFVAINTGDYHLLTSSQCINAGDDTVVVTGSTDIDGATRIQGTHVDIGADEAK